MEDRDSSEGSCRVSSTYYFSKWHVGKHLKKDVCIWGEEHNSVSKTLKREHSCHNKQPGCQNGWSQQRGGAHRRALRKVTGPDGPGTVPKDIRSTWTLL